MRVFTLRTARLNGQTLSEKTVVDIPDSIAGLWLKKGIAISFSDAELSSGASDNTQPITEDQGVQDKALSAEDDVRVKSSAKRTPARRR